MKQQRKRQRQGWCVNVLKIESYKRVHTRLSDLIYDEVIKGPHCKHDVKKEILLELGDQAQRSSDLSGYFRYLANTSGSIRDWTERATTEVCRRYLKHFATEHLQTLFYNIQRKLSEIQNSSEKGFDCVKWLQFVCKSCTLMPVNEGELTNSGGTRTLQNPDYFKTAVEEELKTLEESVTKLFENKSYYDIMPKLRPSPADRLFDKVCGCDKRCPFCKEECDKNANHFSTHNLHECERHRPQCLGGYRCSKTGEMCIGICPYYVANEDRTFQNHDTNWKPVPYKEYKSKYSEWYIPGNNDAEANAYWKWFVYNNAGKIATHFQMEVGKDVNDWKGYSWRLARGSL